ncbi:MIF4G domain-containing protein isoform X2 [Muntiacus reevesi]|uniref:MIF4G domain-containing protein isoform X2 n=1 Tax=Muntiacus reevesi TaxID=9886 RepID=UPI0033071B11
MTSAAARRRRPSLQRRGRGARARCRPSGLRARGRGAGAAGAVLSPTPVKSCCGWIVMGEPGREEYKIQGFDAETQQLLKTALKDPGAVDLEKVANVIVDHSLQDSVFSKEAGRMCYAIIQAESKQAGQSVFRRGLLNRLQQEYQTREQLRARSRQGWVCYVTFICNIFDYLRVNNMPMMALVNPVYDCLFRLAQPDSLSKEEETFKSTRDVSHLMQRSCPEHLPSDSRIGEDRSTPALQPHQPFSPLTSDLGNS